MELYNINEMNRILKRHGFAFSKALGQNFLIDESVCPMMAESLCAGERTGVLEVGPGMGILTKELSRVSEKVVAIELDRRLFPVLEEVLCDSENTEIVCGDVMKIDLHTLIREKFSNMAELKVCANLPYYITSPVIMMLLESKLPIDEIVVMVQKEAAQRLCARVGSREGGAVTVAVNYYSEAEMLFEVSRDSFFPSPNVDSAVIRLKLRKTPPIAVKDEKAFFKLVKAAFSQRRKTFRNSIQNSLGIPKSDVTAVLKSMNIDENVRAENLSMDELASLSDKLF